MMIANPNEAIQQTASAAAKSRLLSCRGEPLFVADWERVLMIHFEVDAGALQRDVPLDLDLRDGRAFVSVVAFTMRGMRPRFGGRTTACLFRPLATHEFLNVRTYVRHAGEPGIHFLAEWLSNRLAVRLGPATFGLPYRYGRICYAHDWRRRRLRGRVSDTRTGNVFEYRAEPIPGRSLAMAPCATGSLDHWLMERYTAFNAVGGRRRFFRIWHPPWPQCEVDVLLGGTSLLRGIWDWFGAAELIGANFSPGLREVWMGWPHRWPP